MGSVSVDTGVLDTSTRFFELVDDIALTDDAVLAAWFLALIRTRDEPAATFEWASDDDHQQHQVNRRRFSSRDALQALDLDENNVGALVQAVNSYLTSYENSGNQKSNLTPVSLLISTGTLSQIDKDDLDEVSKTTIIIIAVTRG